MDIFNRNKLVVLAFILLALGGIADSAYLTYENVGGSEEGILFCAPGESACDAVLTSTYATIGSVPVALLGFLYYFVLGVLSLIAFLLRDKRLLRVAAFITPIGLITSLYFLYLQAIVIGAFCMYCILSATISTLLFIIGMIFLRLIRNDTSNATIQGAQEEGAQNGARTSDAISG